MDSDTIQDLKQFIATTVSQQTADLKDDIGRLDKKIDAIDNKINETTEEILAAVGDSADTHFSVVEEDIKELQTRVTRIESSAV